MKKNYGNSSKIILSVLAGIFAFTGCTTGNTTSEGSSSASVSTAPDASASSAASSSFAEDTMFTPDTLPVIDGSLALVPFYESLASTMLGTDIETARQYVNYTNTDPSYLALIDDTRDVIFVTYPSADELAYAEENGVELEIVPITSEGFVFFVNSQNPVESLTLQQIKDIYSGKITNWSEVGGEDIPLVPYQRRVNSGSQTGMLSLVMNDTPLMDPPTEYIIEAMGEIIDDVANYENNNDAIGYSYYYFVTDMYGEDRIKLLKIDDVYPDKTTISNGTYPICTNYYAVFNADEPEDSNVRKLVDWILSDEGQQMAEEAGYVKLSK